VLHLRPLDLEGVEALITASLGAEADDALVHAVHERAGGGPLYVEHLLRDLADRGRLRRDDAGRWTLVDDAAAELPVDLSTLLVSRLDRLPADVADVVQQAAVLGAEVSRVELARLLGDPNKVERAIPVAVAAGIWEVDEDKPERFVFRHALVRDAAY